MILDYDNQLSNCNNLELPNNTQNSNTINNTNIRLSYIKCMFNNNNNNNCINNILLNNKKSIYGSVDFNNASIVKFNPLYSNVLALSSFNELSIFKITENNKYNEKNYINKNSNNYTNDYELDISFNNHFFNINTICYNETGSLLASGGNDAMINVYDLQSMKLNRNIILSEAQSAVTALSFNYSSNIIITGIYDKQVHLFDLRMNKPALSVIAHSEPITSVEFSEDGLNFLSCSYDGFLRIWDMFKGICLKTIQLENSPAFSKANFLPDNNYVISSTLNNKIQVIDITSEKELIEFKGHMNTNYLLDFDFIYTYNNKYKDNVSNLISDIEKSQSFNFNQNSLRRYFYEELYLVSGSEDGCIYIWDVENVNNRYCYDLNINLNLNNNSLEKVNNIYSLSVNKDNEYLCCICNYKNTHDINYNNTNNQTKLETNNSLLLFKIKNLFNSKE